MRVYYIFSSVLVCLVSSISCNITMKHQCPNCTVQHVKTINAITGRCVECWPCPECHEGSGSSVQCGSTVPVGTQLRCVPCIHGANFSDSSGTGQCQPCGICSGKHEHVLSECTRESDVTCECEVGFYRNKTTQECLPCASCCSTGDGVILEECQRDGGAIKNKCKFTDPWPSTCLSLVIPVATSSSLKAFSYKHSAATPMLSTIAKIAPAPSETVHLKITSASFFRDYSRHSKVMGISTVNNGNVREKRSNMNVMVNLSKTAVVLISLLACALFFAGCTCAVGIYFKWKSWRSRNNPPALHITFNELEAKENESRKSSGCSAVREPLLQLTEHNSPGGTSLDGRVCLLPDQITGADAVNKGIPSALDDGPQNLAPPPTSYRKRLPSEGDDNSAESDLEGHQSHCHIEDDQDGFITVHASVNPAPPSVSPNTACPSSNNMSLVPSALTVGNASDTGKTAGLPPVNETDLEVHVANQGAVCAISVEPPVQSTEDNRGYNTHIKDVPESLILDMCMLLDVERDIDGKDYKMLACELGLKHSRIRYLKELKQMGRSPSYVLLTQTFSAKENFGTLNHLNSVLKKMERFDVVKVLDDWVLNNPLNSVSAF